MKRPPATVVFGLTNVAGTLIVCAGVALMSLPAALIVGGGLVIVLNFAETYVLRGR